jgi:prefoldin subunit 5
MEGISTRVPLLNLNRQISKIDSSLQSLSSEMKRITQQMKQVLEYTVRMGEGSS